VAEVRRREQAGAVAGLAQHGGQHGGGGTFAFGAGDVNDAQSVLRIAQAGEQAAHAVKFEVGRRGRIVFVIDEAVPEGAGFLGRKGNLRIGSGEVHKRVATASTLLRRVK